MAYTHEQIDVIKHPEGHAVVSAVAGSGKTSTMIGRLIYLMSEHVRSEDILVLMFNSKAQKDFESRLKKQCKELRKAYNEDIYKACEVKTFHGFCNQLTTELSSIGVMKTARLMHRPWEVENKARLSLREAISHSRTKIPVSNEVVEDFVSFIDLVKSDIKSPDDKFEELNYKEDYRVFIQGFKNFEIKRRKEGFRTYADLIYDPIKLLKKDKDIREAVSQRYRHLIVDEYQDINEIQQELLRLLTGDDTQVMVVGDADQCIYEWRGAKPEYITSLFEDDFGNCTRYSLTYTFRVGHSISIAANYCIRNNLDRPKQTCYSYPSNPQTELFSHSDNSYGKKAAEIIENWTGKLSEAAILIRLYSMAAPIELEFLSKGIPYSMEGGESRSVLNQSIVESMANYVRLARGTINQGDFDIVRLRYESILEVIPTRMNKELVKILASNMAANDNIRHVLAAVYDATSPNSKKDMFFETGLSKRHLLFKYIVDNMKSASADEIMERVVKDLEINKYYKKLYVRAQNGFERMNLLRGLIDIAKSSEENGVDFVKFIEDCKIKLSSKSKSTDSVTITTIHKAKGMEWPLVIIPGLIEGQFPYYESSTPEVDVESERRLYYVAITRGEKDVHLIHPVSEYVTKLNFDFSCDISEITKESVSRFVIESNPVLSSRISNKIYNEKKDKINAVSGFVAQKYVKDIGADWIEVNSQLTPEQEKNYTKPRGFIPGDRVMHKMFGEGIIENLISDDNAIISIKFDQENKPINFVLKNIELRKVI
jgi:DNA helicase-2/ATP-dependent DNA helicase PcrA